MAVDIQWGKWYANACLPVSLIPMVGEIPHWVNRTKIIKALFVIVLIEGGLSRQKAAPFFDVFVTLLRFFTA